jgi:hypothetical protein
MMAAEIGRSVEEAQESLRELCGVLGLTLNGSIEERVKDGWQRHYKRFL